MGVLVQNGLANMAISAMASPFAVSELNIAAGIAAANAGAALHPAKIAGVATFNAAPAETTADAPTGILAAARTFAPLARLFLDANQIAGVAAAVIAHGKAAALDTAPKSPVRQNVEVRPAAVSVQTTADGARLLVGAGKAPEARLFIPARHVSEAKPGTHTSGAESIPQDNPPIIPAVWRRRAGAGVHARRQAELNATSIAGERRCETPPKTGVPIPPRGSRTSDRASLHPGCTQGGAYSAGGKQLSHHARRTPHGEVERNGARDVEAIIPPYDRMSSLISSPYIRGGYRGESPALPSTPPPSSLSSAEHGIRLASVRSGHAFAGRTRLFAANRGLFAEGKAGDFYERDSAAAKIATPKNSMDAGFTAREQEPPQAIAAPPVSPVQDSISEAGSVIAAVAFNQSGTPGRSDTADPDAAMLSHFESLIMSQLAAGQESLTAQKELAAFNRYLRENFWNGVKPVVSEADWRRFLSEALRLALRHTPVFGDSGARPIEEMFEDAARLIGIDARRFAEWERSLGTDALSAQLAAGRDAGSAQYESSELAERLLGTLDARIGMRAERLLEIPGAEFAFGAATETELQWQAARAGAANGLDQKVAAALSFLMSHLSEKRMKRAGRLLAIIFINSAYNGIAMEHAPAIPQWSKSEIEALFSALVGRGEWELLGHRSFRRYLMTAENRAANLVVAKLNMCAVFKATAADDLADLPDDKFWAAIDGSGRSDEMLDHAVEQMAGIG